MSERIAVVTTSYPRSPGDPAGHFVAAEVRRLTQAGHEVHVFAPGVGARSSEGARVHWIADYGAFGFPGALARLKSNPARALGAGAFSVRAIRALRGAAPFTRVQAHFLLPAAWPIAARAFAPPSALELELVGHGSDVRLFCALPAALRASIARRWLAQRASLRLTSRELAARLSRANPELDAAIRVQQSPIDVEGVPHREVTRAELGLATTLRVAAIVSRLVPAKRVASALHALSLCDDLTVIVVGDGPELARLQARFPHVHFTGRLPRPRALALIAAADVLVSASPEEGAPSVVREARALGVPVVSVPAGDLALWAACDPGLLLTRA